MNGVFWAHARWANLDSLDCAGAVKSAPVMWSTAWAGTAWLILALSALLGGCGVASGMAGSQWHLGAAPPEPHHLQDSLPAAFLFPRKAVPSGKRTWGHFPQATMVKRSSRLVCVLLKDRDGCSWTAHWYTDLSALFYQADNMG